MNWWRYCFHRIVCLCVRSEQVSQTVGALNANSSKTVNATDFKFDTLVPRVSRSMVHKLVNNEGLARVT